MLVFVQDFMMAINSDKSIGMTKGGDTTTPLAHGISNEIIMQAVD